MSTEREIKAKEIVSDIKSGIGDDQLMHKYRLTFRGLQGVYRKLVDSNIIDSASLEGRIIPLSGAEKTMISRLPRTEIHFPLPVQDVANPDNQGTVIDISVRGLGVKGLSSEADEVKELLIKANEFFRLKPFTVKAKCRWVKPSGSSKEMLSGFEIIFIANRELKKLKDLLDTLDYMYR
jgi:hypothetical protein